MVFSQEMKTLNAFFTGHRDFPDNRNNRNAIDCMMRQAEKLGATHFYIGMALGTDQLAAIVLNEAKREWTAVLPCRNYDRHWNMKQKSHAHSIIDRATEIVYVSDSYEDKGTMHKRNQWMVDRSKICLAVYDGRSRGGTKATLEKAGDSGLTIIQYNPKTERTRCYEQLQLL